MTRRFAALVLSAVFATPALADDLVFQLTNDSSQVLDQFYASPSDTDEWGEDILGQDVLNPGETGAVTIADGSDQCEYDLRSVIQGGEQIDERGINLCETAAYTLSDQ